MNKLLITPFTLIFFLLIACSEKADKSQEMRKKIKSLEDTLYSNPESYNKAAAARLMNSYVDFYSAYPDDSLAADYLFKAAEIALQLGDYQKSLVYFRDIHNDYPTYKNRPLALFFQGSIYDDRLNNDERAGEIYKEFLQKYPDHSFAPDVKILLENLGKSDEELIKEFEKRNSVNPS